MTITAKNLVKQIIEEQLHVRVRFDGEKLTDMGADSLDFIELAELLEDEFHIKIEDKELTDAETVRDVIRLVKRKCKQFVAGEE